MWKLRTSWILYPPKLRLRYTELSDLSALDPQTLGACVVALSSDRVRTDDLVTLISLRFSQILNWKFWKIQYLIVEYLQRWIALIAGIAGCNHILTASCLQVMHQRRDLHSMMLTLARYESSIHQHWPPWSSDVTHVLQTICKHTCNCKRLTAALSDSMALCFGACFVSLCY